MNLTGSGDPERLNTGRLSANQFRLLGVRAQLGSGGELSAKLLVAADGKRVGLFVDGIYRPNTAYLNNPLLDVERMICLNAVVADERADPGFRPGEAKAIGSTRIGQALARREAEFVAEADGERATILVPIRSSRGHEFGWIGLTLPGAGGLPAADGIRRRVEALSAAAG